MDGQGPALNLNFGIQELSISHDFLTVKSDFTNSYYYALNGDLMLRDRAPRSILKSQKVLKPLKMEIWVFEKAADLVKPGEEQSSSSASSFEGKSQSSDAKTGIYSSENVSLT